MLHICVGKHNIIGSDDGLAPTRCWNVVNWTHSVVGTNFNETPIDIHTFSFKNMHWKCCLEKGNHFVPAADVFTKHCDDKKTTKGLFWVMVRLGRQMFHWDQKYMKGFIHCISTTCYQVFMSSMLFVKGNKMFHCTCVWSSPRLIDWSPVILSLNSLAPGRFQFNFR